ncbi:ABC transporter substrate-binding protein [Paenibacillus turpanensis]|uniref:ABC transporter substrate-binding protein n=1 Tax=Paenibacillus turpanensis TaxID=2689078 RepID=UPI00140BF162|nr:ABC transporter substrate-binding protein [Paenibacillus turpanensis]
MNKKWMQAGLIAVMAVALAACGAAQEQTTPSKSEGETKPAAAPASGTEAKNEAPAAAAQTKTIKYKDKEYTVPTKTDKVVITGSMESMEDALVLGVQPIGGISVGGKFPAMFAPITGKTESIGEKQQPNVETVLKLKPEVILATTKFKPEVKEKLEKIATTIPVSHIATDWEANLKLLAELTGKEAEAEKALKQYKDDVAAAKAKLGDKLKDKKVMIIRLRAGNINLYPADVFFNPSLYTDLGFAVPEQVKAAKAQEVVSMEKFSEINPDYLFVQFSEDENKDKPKTLEELQNNPIWKSLNAVKNGKVFVNVVDPLAQGGTAWSKINFLKAAVEKLSN